MTVIRQRRPRGDQRRAHPLARFGHRLVGQADNGKGGETGRDLDLHVDRAGLDPLKSDGGNPLNHAAPLMQWRVAELAAMCKNITGTWRALAAPRERRRTSIAGATPLTVQGGFDLEVVVMGWVIRTIVRKKLTPGAYY